MLARHIVVIILQFIQLSNHCVPETNRMLHVNHTSIKQKEEKLFINKKEANKGGTNEQKKIQFMWTINGKLADVNITTSTFTLNVNRQNKLI